MDNYVEFDSVGDLSSHIVESIAEIINDSMSEYGDDVETIVNDSHIKMVVHEHDIPWNVFAMCVSNHLSESENSHYDLDIQIDERAIPFVEYNEWNEKIRGVKILESDLDKFIEYGSSATIKVMDDYMNSDAEQMIDEDMYPYAIPKCII